MQTQTIDNLRGSHVVDCNGDKIGKIDEVYLEDDAPEPAWLLVNTGWFGSKSSFVPMREARIDDGTVRVPFEKDRVKDAPRIDADEHLSASEEKELFRYYGFRKSPDDHGGTPAHTGSDAGRSEAGRSDADRSDASTGQSQTTQRETTTPPGAGKPRLRKYVVTERVDVDVQEIDDNSTSSRR